MNFAGRAGIYVAGFLLTAAMAGAQSGSAAPPSAPVPQAGASQAGPATSNAGGGALPPAPVSSAQDAAVAPSSGQSASAPNSPSGGTIRGKVSSGAEKNTVSLPGVSVTATNALTGEKYVTVTDATGIYAMQIPKDGRYVVRTELAGFAAGTKSVLLNADNRSATVDLGMELASRVKENAGEAIAGASAMGLSGRGTQALTLQGGVAGAMAAGIGGGNQPSLPSASQGDTGSDAVAISGAAGSTSAAFNFDAARQSMEDQRDLQRSTEARGGSGPNYSGGQGYGILGGGRGGFFGGGAGGRRLNMNAIHGSAVYQVTNSVFNARNFAVTGQPESQPPYGNSRYGLVYAGPLIPGLLETKTDFLFLAAVGNHGSSLYDQSSIVPTAAERAGDFSGLVDPTTNTLVPIYNPYTSPATGVPYPNNNITDCTGPGCGISPIAAALLPYIPLPNQAQASPSDPNYRLLESQQTNTDQLNARYVHNFGGGGSGGGPAMIARMMGGAGTNKLSQNLNANFSFQHTSEDEVTLFPAFGGKDQLYQSVVSIGYNASKNAWNNTLTGSWNRTDSEARNFFTGITNVAGNAGIQGVGLTPFFYGLPTLTFSGYAGGTEQEPSSRIQQVAQISENLAYIHKDHNVRMGGDIRRMFLDVVGGVQGTGFYTFTGFATAYPSSGSTGSPGNSFADFLIGIPQQGKLQAPCTGNVPAGICNPGPPDYYLRGNEFSLFAQDTWHYGPALTLLYGLRYEYFSPYSEENDRIANLDPNPTFTDVAVVTPNQTGPFGGKYPHSLIQPFRDGFAPRVGFAWKAARNTVVRGGYGINYNTSVYGNFVQDLAYQRPFALANNNTQSNLTPAADYFTLANGLTNVTSTSCTAPPCITNNYAVDKHYRMGYVQGYNLDIQQTLGKGYLLNIGYNGSKGTHLDGLLAPNRIFGVGPSTPNAQVFDYEVSEGQSKFNALAVRLRKRLQNGIAVGATYTYSHSIDDASTIGGTTAAVAQEPTNLRDDLGNSSFDQRHVVKGDFTYELPFGPHSKFLNSGNWASHALNGLQLYGDFQFATGEPLNPIYAAAANEVATGVTNSLRPNRIPGSSLEGGPSQLQEWFNVNAFTPLNAADVTGYGTAARNSIPGPGVREFDAAFSKYFELGGTRSLEFRLTANNVFNVVQYNTVSTAIDSFNAGRVLNAAAMRNMLLLVRYRF